MGRKLISSVAVVLAAATGCAKAHSPVAQSSGTPGPPASSAIETPVPAAPPANTASISNDLNSVDAGLGQVDGQLSDANDGMSHNESGDVQ